MPSTDEAPASVPEKEGRPARVRSMLGVLLIPLGAILTLAWIGLLLWYLVRTALAEL